MDRESRTSGAKRRRLKMENFQQNEVQLESPKLLVCTTSRRVESVHLKWTVNMFSCLLDEETPHLLTSSPFIFNGQIPGEWQFMMYPKGRTKVFPNYLSLCLVFTTTVEADFKMMPSSVIKIKSAGGQDYSKSFCIKKDYSKGKVFWGWNQFITVQELQDRALDLLPNDIMSIVCEGAIDLGLTNSPCLPIRVSPPGLSDDFEKLMTSKIATDVILKSEGKALSAHKNILSARSSVFASMFFHDTLENQSGEVMIEDIAPEVLTAMIYFMYTDKEPKNMALLASDILVAAEKYDLQRLKEMCENHLATRLNIENVFSILSLASTHNAPQLKRACLNYASSRMEVLKKTSMWKEAQFLPPQVLVNLLEMATAVEKITK